MLLVRDRARLVTLPAPWSEVGEGADEVVLEFKLAGDHVDMVAVQRTLLRRQARQVQRCEDAGAPYDGEIPLWMVAPHLPRWLADRRHLDRIAPGCYGVGPSPFQFLWLAANELPLRDELIPFLLLRTGRPLDELCRWLTGHRSPVWLARVVEFLPMSAAVYEELLRWVATRTEDPVINDKKRRAVRVFLDMTPEVREEVVAEGRIVEGRKMLRRALAHRKLVPTPEQDARIQGCADPATLERWHDQAMDATSVTEALG
jgi:hypothetical protein